MSNSYQNLSDFYQNNPPQNTIRECIIVDYKANNKIFELFLIDCETQKICNQNAFTSHVRIATETEPGEDLIGLKTKWKFNDNNWNIINIDN